MPHNGSGIELDGWEPASHVLTCARQHTWGSHGRYHKRLSLHDPRIPDCPHRGCGLPWAISHAHTGPRRPHVIEPEAT